MILTKILPFVLAQFTLAQYFTHDSIKNLNGAISGEDVKRLMQSCSCANDTLTKIKSHLDEYKAQKLEDKSVDGLVKTLTGIAQECTRTSKCGCPEGYVKSDDKCLMISREYTTCKRAVQECKRSFNSRLVVAKTPAALISLQQALKLSTHGDDFFWIGLAYPKNQQYSENGGTWTWSDGSHATSHTKSAMGLYQDLNVKKAAQLRMIDIGGEEDQELVRVAVKGNSDTGLVYDTGFCSGAIDDWGQTQHKYVCEFLMFQVDISPSNQMK